MFSCEFYGIFKSTFLTEHLRTTASGIVGYDPVVSIEEAVHRYSKKKLVWQILHKSTKKELYQSLFFDNILGLKPATLLKRESGKVFFFCE